MAVATRPAGAPPAPVIPDQLVEVWRQRIAQGREYRKQFEPIWLSNLAFAAGQMWLAWDNGQKRMRHLADLDPRYSGRELYTADRINEQRQAQLGELTSDTDRPELLLAQDGDQAEQLQKEINAAVAYGWDHEWNTDQALLQARRLCLDLGTSAIRTWFNPNAGKPLGEIPIYDGRPVQDPEQARQLLANGPRDDVQIKSVREGRTCMEPLSAFNLLTPPGCNHEDAFPWEIVLRPVLLDDVLEAYGIEAGALQEDNDIASVIGLSTSQQLRTSSASENPATRGRLRGHVWLYTCFERPSKSSPKGRVVVLGSNQLKLLSVKDELPYQAPDGTPRSGITYFHWWRLNDRFYSRSFVEPMKDPQRLINRRETQNAEIIDRGMPKVFTEEGTLLHDPTGMPLENIELKKSVAAPVFHPGLGPGPWMYEDINHHIDNLAHASTLSPLRLGENPTNVDTYSQLALLNENESAKRSAINQEHALARARLVEDGVWDIRRYWPDQKRILVAGDDDRIAAQTFNKSKIPDFFIVKVPKGTAQPRSQAAELTKIDAIWNAAVATGVVVNNEKWVRWYAESLDAGNALDLPVVDVDSQAELAAFENFLMLHEGLTPQPADYDLAPVHIPIHREAQDEARAAGDAGAYQRLEQHIQLTIQVATINAQRVAAAQAAPAPGGIAAPPGPPTPSPQVASPAPSNLQAAAAGPQQ